MAFITLKAGDELLKKFKPAVDLLNELQSTKLFVAGGFFRSALLGQVPKDLDLFMTVNSKREVSKVFDVVTRTRLYNPVTGGHEYADEEEDTGNWVDVYNTSTKTICFQTENLENIKEIDLIKREFGSPASILRSFDFTVTQAALRKTAKGEFEFTFSDRYFANLNNRTLSLAEGAEISDRLLSRCRRYINYGFTPDESVLVHFPELREKKN